MSHAALAESTRIVITGLRNAGKSSFMNNLFKKDISIVSDIPGTTTDPVTRNMELGHFGACAIVDTAGFDESGELGLNRRAKSLERLKTSDFVLFISRADKDVTNEEKDILNDLLKSNKQFFIILTFAESAHNSGKIEWAKKHGHYFIDNVSGNGVDVLQEVLTKVTLNKEPELSPVQGLVSQGDMVLLVTPIDSAAPKGRLILPQSETLRDLLDKDCGVVVVKETGLKSFYNKLSVRPKLVITDSQAFKEVINDIPHDQPLTSFSILFARKKGELDIFLQGIKALKNTPSRAKILVMESCSHHRKEEDIGTVKIPALFKKKIRDDVEFYFTRKLPEVHELKNFYLIIHCGACMVTSNLMKSRINEITNAGVAITNYGLFLSWVNGILPRAVEPLGVDLT